MNWQLENEDVLHWLKTLKPNSIDALYTDPPYCSGGMFRSDRVQDQKNRIYIGKAAGSYPEFMGENKDQWSYFLWSTLWMSDAFRALKQGAVFAVFIDWRQIAVLHAALQAAGFVVRGIVVWDKTQGTRPQMSKFRQQSEFVLWGSKGPWSKEVHKAFPGVYKYAPLSGGKKLHACGKPVQLMKDLMSVAKPKGLVLDPFAGSASTGVAALETGRSFIGCEQDAAYHQIATDRLKQV